MTTSLAPLGETGELLQRLLPEMRKALPKGMEADRMVRLMATEIRKSQLTPGPSLLDCTKESFAGALLTASALGLEPGVNGECWLIPYRDNKRNVVDCQFIAGYQGILKLFWQHPRAEFIDAQTVGANDEFRFSKGLKPDLHHVPNLQDPGEPIAYYAIAKAVDAQHIWDVFSVDEIKKLRGGRVGTRGDITDPQHWMERKTALKQVLKLAPKTTRLDSLLALDESSGSELYRSQGYSTPAVITAPEARAVTADEIMAAPKQVEDKPKRGRPRKNPTHETPWCAACAQEHEFTGPQCNARPTAEPASAPFRYELSGHSTREVMQEMKRQEENPPPPEPPEQEADGIEKPLPEGELPRYTHDPKQTHQMFNLLDKAGISFSALEDRPKLLAVYRFFTHPQVSSTDHLTPDEVKGIIETLYNWQKLKQLQARVDEIVIAAQDDALDAARDAEETPPPDEENN